MKIIDKKLSELTPYANNPRLNDGAVDAVAASIKAFGFKVPLCVTADGVIVAGHTRLKAAQKLGLKTVPCIVADDLTPEQIKEFRTADNKVGELADWDIQKLEIELADLSKDHFDMTPFGFSFETPEEGADEDDRYTSKVDIPQYTPTGKKVSLSECVDVSKYESLLKEIDDSTAREDVKAFLRLAATRFLAFSYKNIAEYYANEADAATQALFERLALVIIDYDDAMKNGFIEISATLQDIIDHGDEE